MKNHLEEYPGQNEPEHTSEEEKAYQEWEEMLELNQQAEEIIEKNQTKVPEIENEKRSEKLTDEYEADHKKENLFSTMHHTKDWTNDFPSVYSHSLYYGDSVNDKNYAENIKTALLVGKAKRGDRDAAIDLVNQSVRPEIIKELHEKYPDAIVCAVDGLEANGHNMIPLMYKKFLSEQGFSIDGSIVQSAKAHHTGADNLDKLLNRVRFSGEVQKGKDYILLDDHISMGSTLRTLRDYIESNGGNVVAVTTLTAPKHDYKISISKENFEKLSVYGEPLNEFLREYGITDNIKGLTDREDTEIIGLLSDRGRNPETQEGIRRSACLRCREIQENYLANLSGSLKKEATDTIQTVIARNSYALEHSSIREQVGAVVESIALDNEKSILSQLSESAQETATNFVLEKLQQAGIKVITDESAMKSILDAGKEVQKMAAHYGTSQNIEESDTFSGYGA